MKKSLQKRHLQYSERSSGTISRPKWSLKSKWTEWVSSSSRIVETYDINSDIFYTGLPPKKFPDFKRLADYVLSGELLEKIGNEEAVDIETVPLAWNKKSSVNLLVEIRSSDQSS